MDSRKSSPLQHPSEFIQQSPQSHDHEVTMAPPPMYTPSLILQQFYGPMVPPPRPPPYSYITAPTPTVTPPPQLLQELPLFSHEIIEPPITSTPPSQFSQQPPPYNQETVAPPPTFTPPPNLFQQPPPYSQENIAPSPTFTPSPQLLQQPPPPTSTPPPKLLQQAPPPYEMTPLPTSTLLPQLLQQPLPSPPHPLETMAPPQTPTPTPPPQQPSLPTSPPQQPSLSTPPPQPQPHHEKQPENDMVPAKIIFHQPQQPQQPNFQFPFNSLFGQQQKSNLDHSEGSATATATAAAQKKSGRPRKSSAAGNPSGPVLSPTPITQIPLVVNQPHSGVSPVATAGGGSSQNLVKRPRGRPVGSGKKRKQEALDSGAAPLGNPSSLGGFPATVVSHPGCAAASGNLFGLSLFPTPVVNQADSVATASRNPSGLGLPSTPVVCQADSGATPLENPSGLGHYSTPVVNQADVGATASSEIPAKKARGRPPGSGKKNHPKALDSGAYPLGNLSGLGLFQTPVVNQVVLDAVTSGNPSGLGLFPTPVMNHPDSVVAAPSENPSVLGFSFTPVMNQVDDGATAPSGNPSGLGLPPTPVVSQADFGAAPSANPSSLGLYSTPVVNQADFGVVAPSRNPAKKARGRPPGSGKKQNPEALDSGATAPENPAKKARGRPQASGKKKQPEALGAVGLPMHHLILVDIGEDILTKAVVPFSQRGPSAVCILSATGDLSKVTVRQAAIGGDTVTHEGRFAIASLSGSFDMSESCKTGGLSVSLYREDGTHVGGVVAGPLTAASPVQVVLCSFIPNKEKPESMAPSSTPPPNV